MVKQNAVTELPGMLSQNLASILLLKMLDQLFVHHSSGLASFS